MSLLNTTAQRGQQIRPFRYFILNKPYGVLCQFTDAAGRQTLASLGVFPPNVYPVGRLDADSEGLILLTNDNTLKHHLTEPRYAHDRTYLVQVERIPSEESIGRLKRGIVIEGRKTLPAEVRLLDSEPYLPPRSVPIRFRKAVPTTWLQITMREGRNRQIRKMTAAVGHPTLRLVRIGIGSLTLEGLEVGGNRELTQAEISSLRSLTRRQAQRL